MSTATMRRANSADSSSQEHSLDSDSQSDDVFSEDEADVSKQTHNLPYLSSDNFQQGQHNIQLGTQNILPRNEEAVVPVPQPELLACAPNPYYDPYYGGMMAAYGQHLVHPQFVDMHQVRMPLPLEMAQEPVYVNAKQYHAILRRRQSRAKAELEKKLIKDRKPYLHESRHQHAMRRMRSSGGRFAKKTEGNASKSATDDKNATSSSTSSMKRARSESTESLNTHQEATGGMVNNSCNGRAFSADGARYESQEARGNMVSSYQLHGSDIGVGEGGSLGQQWSSMQSNQAAQRAVAMK
ncbi:nuclear transcription factor Y subunit A-9-like [Bidens hawaiensis]|uniref:nuclear transcription factor Y subunit A-9-like n=1 Tax=Bidens hawaiensis TaxID=980011 RepID=UPI00404A8AEF